MVSFRKSKKFGPFRFGVSKRGVSGSVGVGGLRVSKGADGKVRRTVGIPGTGVYDTKVIGGGKTQEPETRSVGVELTGEGPPLTIGQRDHLRCQLERVGTRNMPDLSDMTLADGNAILEAIGGEQLPATKPAEGSTYICSECDEGFDSWRAVARHERAHTAAKRQELRDKHDRRQRGT